MLRALDNRTDLMRFKIQNCNISFECTIWVRCTHSTLLPIARFIRQLSYGQQLYAHAHGGVTGRARLTSGDISSKVCLLDSTSSSLEFLKHPRKEYEAAPCASATNRTPANNRREFCVMQWSCCHTGRTKSDRKRRWPVVPIIGVAAILVGVLLRCVDVVLRRMMWVAPGPTQ